MSDAPEVKASPTRFIIAHYPMFETKLASVSGKELDASALRDKVTMLHFWGIWCPPCVEEIPEIVAFAKRNKDKLNFVPIHHRANAAQLVDWLKDKSWAEGIEWYVDPDSVVYSRFWGLFVPSTIFLNPEGKVVVLEEGEFPPTSLLVGPRPWHDPLYEQLVRDILKDNNAFKGR